MEKQQKLEYLYAIILIVFCLLIFVPLLLEDFIVGPTAAFTSHPLTGFYSKFNPFGIGNSNESIGYSLTAAMFIIIMLGWIARRKKVPFWQGLLYAIILAGLFFYEAFYQLK